LRVLPECGSVVDVGAGASILAEALIESGCTEITILDLSTEALDVVRRRLPSGVSITLIATDVLEWKPARAVDVWHDRAVFHFLVNPSDRLAYAQTAQAAVRRGGALVIGTFAEDGPESCSGLPAVRYGPLELAAEFADYFELEYAEREQHRTPTGAIQPFTWAMLRRL
jgi:2-polyprenyl-3-methyl-5-hydroxy-6-metoxy-1,4-benzoquinol methylase